MRCGYSQSVETAMDPKVAEAVTVGGMGNVLGAMREVGARRVCFTDSIGSFVRRPLHPFWRPF
jgi:nucleoside-diphosphate-sugar epimerase